MRVALRRKTGAQTLQAGKLGLHFPQLRQQRERHRDGDMLEDDEISHTRHFRLSPPRGEEMMDDNRIDARLIMPRKIGGSCAPSTPAQSSPTGQPQRRNFKQENFRNFRRGEADAKKILP
jgi:hypothetical protein